MNHTHSQELFQKAQNLIPGGVNSPVRAFKAVGGQPIFFEKAKGPYLFDTDGNRYIDYIGSWGPMILGHGHPEVLKALQNELKKALSFGAPCELEIALAEKVQKAFPSMQKMRFVSSGTEAVMSAVRVARGYTKKNKIIKFDGCYHGHADSLLVKGGSGLATLGTPDSAGVPPEFTAHTLVAKFNDIESVKAFFDKFPQDIAGIILEPVVGNMGVIPPQPGFLQSLRNICDEHQSLLIFDEVMTGFRVAHGGAQELYKITPDMTTLGKIIGGGLPVGAYGGRKEIMDVVAPLGPVYQAGTLSGNPMAMAAGIATLTVLETENPYPHLLEMTQHLAEGLREIGDRCKTPVTLQSVGSMITLFFHHQIIHNADDARGSDTSRFKIFFQTLLNEGIYWPPSQFEAAFLSMTHTKALISKTLKAAKKAIKAK